MPGYALHLRLRCRTAIGVQNGGSDCRVTGGSKSQGVTRSWRSSAVDVSALNANIVGAIDVTAEYH